ncbi:MAG: 2-oxo-4-hydroxy-4-carboxy-5-ureidoimidazoline decarboxylase [Herpetosiphonaceae bacterium]|nr:2-oxo-4-hydroxy-4-carboxy-5-ureidoimidazoline decarboxylase [Herpetosiphonaceae bacterium]
MEPTTLPVLNTLDETQFVARLGFVFEDSPWIVAEGWRTHPWSSLEELHQALCQVMYAATPEQQLALIRAHPDLVGKAALAGSLTPQSTGEQAAAGLDRLSADEIALFTQLNQAYHERFQFPFVICARENKKDSILAGFNTRLHNGHEQEVRTALAEIAKIAWLRLRDVVVTDTM